MSAIKVYSKSINGRDVSLSCNEVLSSQAEFMLDLLAEEQKTTNVLKNDFKLQIGWSIYVLKENPEGFTVLSPDFAGNPFTELTKDLTFPITIQVEQNTILKKAGVKGKQISFQDRLTVLKDALDGNLIYLQRDEPSGDDSGWYLGLLEDENDSRDENDYIRISVANLIRSKPVLLKLLALPVGCIAVIEGDTIIEVVDGENNKLI